RDIHRRCRMTETLAALLFAHALADFVFQTQWMVDNKRRPQAMLAHIAVVLATALAATGSLSPLLLALALAHLTIDATKTFSGRRGLGPFLADQAAHMASLVILARVAPNLWAEGLWGPGGWAGSLPGAALWTAPPVLPGLMALGAGLIIAVRAGGFAVGFLMEPWATASPQGLPNGGRMIGAL